MGFRAAWMASTRGVIEDLANELGEGDPVQDAEDVGLYELRRRDGSVLLGSGAEAMEHLDRERARQASAGGEVVWWQGDEGDTAAEVAVYADGVERWGVSYDRSFERSGAIPTWVDALLDRARDEHATTEHDACFEALVVLGEKLGGLRFDRVDRTPWLDRRAIVLPDRGPPPGTYAECPGATLRASVLRNHACTFNAYLLDGWIQSLMVTVKRTSGISVVQRDAGASSVRVELTPDVQWLEAMLLFSGGRHGTGSLKLRTVIADLS